MSTIAPPSSAGQVEKLLGNAIRSIGIPPCPAILEQINAEMRRDEPDFKRLTGIIGSDVGVAAGLISIANSPFFATRTRARSVNEALMTLGLNAAGKAVAGLILQKLFPLTPHLERFWNASSSIAKLSGWLAQQNLGTSKISADDAYTFGLFRDGGIPMMLNRFGNYLDTLKAANEDTERKFTDIEDAAHEANHAMIGGLLAQGWWLPEEICLAIRYHHDYEELLNPAAPMPRATRIMIATAQLAEQLYQHSTGQSRTAEWPKAQHACLQLLVLDEDSLNGLYEQSAVLIKDMKA